MDMLEVIYARRSVRAYAQTPVDRPLIEELLGCAVQAPDLASKDGRNGDGTVRATNCPLIRESGSQVSSVRRGGRDYFV